MFYRLSIFTLLRYNVITNVKTFFKLLHSSATTTTTTTTSYTHFLYIYIMNAFRNLILTVLAVFGGFSICVFYIEICIFYIENKSTSFGGANGR